MEQETNQNQEQNIPNTSKHHKWLWPLVVVFVLVAIGVSAWAVSKTIHTIPAEHGYADDLRVVSTMVTALELFHNDHNRYPTKEEIQTLIPDYIGSWLESWNDGAYGYAYSPEGVPSSYHVWVNLQGTSDLSFFTLDDDFNSNINNWFGDKADGTNENCSGSINDCVYDKVHTNENVIGEIVDWQTYRNEEFGFEFKYPKELTLEISKANQSFSIRKIDEDLDDLYPPISVFSVAILSSVNPLRLDTKTWAEKEINDSIVSEVEQITVAGNPAVRFIEAGLLGNPEVYVSREPDIYNISFSFNHLLPEAAEDQVIYNKILSTFKFIDTVETGKVWPTNIFKISELKLGDIVSGMKVVSIKPFNEGVPAFSIEENVSIVFEGETSIRGTLIDSEGIITGDRVNVGNKEEVTSLPIAASESRFVWFVPANEESLSDMYGSGEKTLTINRYEVNLYPSEVFNKAYVTNVRD